MTFEIGAKVIYLNKKKIMGSLPACNMWLQGKAKVKFVFRIQLNVTVFLFLENNIFNIM